MATRKRRQFQDIFTEVFSGSVTVDIASIANGASGIATITVPGVVLGDAFITASVTATATNLHSLTFSAGVSAADTVILRYNNNSGGAIDPASATFTVVMGRVNPALAV